MKAQGFIYLTKKNIMGTRATVKFYMAEPKEDEKPILNCYYQFDGYYDGVGKELADFLKTKKVINGIQGQTMEQGFANGIQCLAAQFVANQKNSIGGFYIAPITDSESYDYKVWVNGFEIYMQIDEFDGNPINFDAFLEAQQNPELLK